MRKLILTTLILTPLFVSSQAYDDYIGSGHNKGITVTTSSDLTKPYWSKTASGDQTLNGSGLEGKLAEMSRLLHQATLGFNEEELSAAIQLTPEEWVDQQLVLPASPYMSKAYDIQNMVNQQLLEEGRDSSEIGTTLSWVQFRYAWWQNALDGQDQLRQKMAYALSQTLVISDETDLQGHGDGLCGYYDVLMEHAFGNYRDLLYDVTLHPSMGFYLSHLNNPKEDLEENIHPDQNYAREIMQLFSIGLLELNLDGSYKLDNQGNTIPTYTNTHIEELSKVFTGLSIGETYDSTDNLYFGRYLYGSKMHVPMIMYEEWHQQGEKNLLNGLVIPDGQTGLEDINDAIDMLFNHPNVGPFIGRQLIQRFVTSNPSSQYIERVATVFNNDGNGVRGNMAAVIKAILLDEEARSCASISNDFHGKMVEPVERKVHFIKSIGYDTPSGIYLNHAYGIDRDLFQHPLSAPSVFNFYTPDYSPSGSISDNGLVAPEFQIINTLTVIDYPNFVHGWTFYSNSNDQWESDYFRCSTSALGLLEPAFDNEVLLNKIDLLFCNGNMSDETRTIIRDAIKEYPVTLGGINERINQALYLTMISPDYIILK